MDNYFETTLLNAILTCEGCYISDDKFNHYFSDIYPFTTENITGYINKFNLNNKSLLTIGSSGDQVINASLFGCKDQTVIDICPYTKFYFYLKKSALLTLNYNEFLKFFCYKDFPKVFEDNKNVFNIKLYKKIYPVLRLLDYESFLFWDELFSLFDPITIRKQLFSTDEDRIRVLKRMNLYLKNKQLFNDASKSIKNITPNFIIDDIYNISINKKFDNIFLSNLGQHYSVNELENLLNKLSFNLNDNGKMLGCYLYKTTKDTEYREEWAEIYNLDKTFKVLNKYITSFESFIGTKGILHKTNDWKDSVLIYQKKVNN